MNRILLIIHDSIIASTLKALIEKVLKRYNIEVFIVDNALDGMSQYNYLKPIVVIVDADIPTLNAFSTISILKDADPNCLMYILVGEDTPMLSAKIDCFFNKPLDYDFIASQLSSIFEKKNMNNSQVCLLEKAKQDQKNLLPGTMFLDSFVVDYIYSPFGDLSGDCLDYWFGHDKKGLYGFLFDCTGHDINAFSQVNEIRALFHINFRYYRSNDHERNLGFLMQNVNEELFRLHGDNVPCCAAVAFYIDFEELKLHYCSAGIPSFFIRYQNSKEYQEIEMVNYLVGYEPDAEFNEKRISLEEIDDVIFSSDGFSELLYKAAGDLSKAKHDDISAVFIKIKNTKKCNEIE